MLILQTWCVWFFYHVFKPNMHVTSFVTQITRQAAASCPQAPGQGFQRNLRHTNYPEERLHVKVFISNGHDNKSTTTK